MIQALLLVLSLTALGLGQKQAPPRLRIFARIDSEGYQSLREWLEELRKEELQNPEKGHPFIYKLRRVGVPSRGRLPPAEVYDLALGIPRIEVLRKKRYIWKKDPLPEGSLVLGFRFYAPFVGGARPSRLSWAEFFHRAPKSLLLPDPLVEPSILEALASVGEAYGRDRVSQMVLAGGLVRFLTSRRIKKRLSEDGGRFGIMVAAPKRGERLPAGRLFGVVSRASKHPVLAARVLLKLRDGLGEKPLFGALSGSLHRSLPSAKDAILLETASYWAGNEKEGPPENWIDTLLLILFGLAFLFLLKTALRR